MQVIRPLMTMDRARAIRVLRVENEETYRGVAGATADLWGGVEATWGDNQLAGMALCWLAAEMLDEDPDAEPWN